LALRSNVASRPPAHKPKTPRPLKTVRPPRNNDRLVHDIVGILCVCLGLLMWVGLIFYSDSGQFGHMLSSLLRLVFGIGSYVVPLVLVYAGIVLIIGNGMMERFEIGIGATLVFLAALAWWHYGNTTGDDQFDTDNLTEYGGYVGAGICAGLRHALGVGSWLVYVAVILGSLVWIFDRRLLHIVDGTAKAGKRVISPVSGGIRSWREHRAEKRAAVAGASASDAGDDAEYEKPARLRLSKAPAPVVSDDELPTLPTIVHHDATTIRATQLPARPKDAPPHQPALRWDRLGEVVDHVNKEYQLPSVDLLKPSPPPTKKPDGVIAEKQAVLMQCLNDFKIGANVQQVAVGPTVTRYEVQLEPGILVKKIVALADNLAMSLAAIDVRVEAPIPGKSAIGIEVPNEVTQMVSIRECLETTEFSNAPSKLTFALGKDVAGNYKYADLASMPHLLIGGSTNSGKSVCLNAIIVSMVYRATPREVKFVMIDPKRVELSLYDGIPHLLTPVVKDTKMAAGILRSVLKEMDKRYEAFARLGTRNLEGYNNKVSVEERFPFIVVIIDELADLMMLQGPEVETSICRLAQLARATGIHLVIATQRPSVDVITGTIKANIASRIAFAVATQIDSRTIIDMTGADRLIGRGDMLFLPIDASKPLRVQGCFVSEKETESLVKYLKTQEEPNYSMLPTDNSSGFSDNGGDEDDDGANDDLFETCVRWVVTQREASTSSLQRKFKIGYTRAARIVDTMEAKGIVGPMDGVKRREVMVAPENLELLFGGKQQGIVEGMND
jgi:DNA segregation ATPase FtsK/SpoIIIE, S-DNA-T family